MGYGASSQSVTPLRELRHKLNVETDTPLTARRHVTLDHVSCCHQKA